MRDPDSVCLKFNLGNYEWQYLTFIGIDYVLRQNANDWDATKAVVEEKSQA